MRHMGDTSSIKNKFYVPLSVKNYSISKSACFHSDVKHRVFAAAEIARVLDKSPETLSLDPWMSK